MEVSGAETGRLESERPRLCGGNWRCRPRHPGCWKPSAIACCKKLLLQMKGLVVGLYLLDDTWCNEVGTSTPTAAVAALTMVLNLSSLSNRIWSQMISWGHLCCSVHAYEGWGVKPTDGVRLSAKMGEGTKSLQYPCWCHQRVSSWVERLHRRHFIVHLHADSCFKKALKIVLLVRKIVGCVGCVPKTTAFFVGHYPLWWVLPLL